MNRLDPTVAELIRKLSCRNRCRTYPQAFMSQLPRISGREVVKAMKQLGYEFDRQTGSHMILRQTVAPHRRLTIPDHREIAKGTLRSIIREAGLTVAEFKNLL